MPSIHTSRDAPWNAAASARRLLIALLALAAIGACAGSPPEQTESAALRRPSDSVSGSSIARLRSMAAHPSGAHAAGITPPDVLGADAVEPDVDLPARATRKLDDVIAELGAWLDENAGQTSTDAVDPEDRIAAIKEYAAGRAMILAGDAQGAERALEEATWLDPNAGPAWISLGLARLALAKRSEAIQALERAVDLGERDPTALDALGRASIESGEPDRSVEYLAAALADLDAIDDPGLINVLQVDLGLALEQAGYLLASVESLQRGLDLPQPGTIDTSQGPELDSIHRRSPALWTQAGDTAIRVGNFDLAFECYERAASLLEQSASPLVARRIYASLATGNDAAGALAVIDHIVEHARVVTSEDLSLIRYLADNTTLDSLLAGSIEEIEAAAGGSSRTLDVDLMIARAQAMSPRAARDLLHTAVERYGLTSSLMTQLYRTHGGSSARELAEEAAWMLQRSAIDGPEVVDRLFRNGRDPDALEQAIVDSKVPWARVLETWYWLERYEPDKALASLQRVEAPLRDRPGVDAAQVRYAALVGDWDRADAAIERLRQDPSIEAQRTLVRALAWMQRFDEAGRVARDVAARPDAASDDMRDAARLGALVGELARTKQLLRDAVAEDPHDEASRDFLINAALATSPPDTDTVQAQAREIRQLRPEGRLVKWLLVSQMLQRGFSDRAEPVLLSLLDADAGDQRSFDALVGIWSQRASQGDDVDFALSWLDPQIATRPFDTWLVEGKARVLVSAGRTQDAVDVLAEAEQVVPAPSLARLREALLRDELGRADEASSLAIERLRNGPQGVVGTVDLVTALIERDQVEQALVIVTDRLPAGIRLTDDQARRLAGAIDEAAKQGTPDRPLLDLFVALGSLGLPIGPELADVWLARIEASGEVADAVAFIEAIRDDVAYAYVTDTAANAVEQQIERDYPKSQLAYRLAGDFSRLQRGDSLALYRLALRVYPKHPLAANDLGYFLLERGDSLEEAESLLEIALEGQPTNASVLDSVGWLRYHQGILEDQLDAEGHVVRRGAVPLLEDALQRADATREPLNTCEIREHLGDAYWQLGRTDQAVATWVQTRQIMQSAMRRSGALRSNPTLTEGVSRLEQKVDAARSGQSPPVTPMISRQPSPDAE